MAKYKIEYLKDECIGCKVCVELCPNWVDDDDKVKPLETDVDKLGTNKDAAESCPVDAIKITEED